MYQAPMQPYAVPGHPGYYYMPGSSPSYEGPLAMHSGRAAVMWDPSGTSYTPRPSMQASKSPFTNHTSPCQLA